MTVWAIVLAAGSGRRFGASDQADSKQADSKQADSKQADSKQFVKLGGVRVVDRAVATARDACDAVVVVLPAGASWAGEAVDAAVLGGATRAESVRAGLAVIPAAAEIVVVHDAARPLATRELFDAVIAAVRAGADAAVPGVGLRDTVKRVIDDRVVETLARDELVAVQTPQAFGAAVLRAAHARNADATDDAALVERAGGVVVVVPGDPCNFKLTDASDLVAAEAVVAHEART